MFFSSVRQNRMYLFLTTRYLVKLISLYVSFPCKSFRSFILYCVSGKFFRRICILRLFCFFNSSKKYSDQLKFSHNIRMDAFKTSTFSELRVEFWNLQLAACLSDFAFMRVYTRQRIRVSSMRTRDYCAPGNKFVRTKVDPSVFVAQYSKIS